MKFKSEAKRVDDEGLCIIIKRGAVTHASHSARVAKSLLAKAKRTRHNKHSDSCGTLTAGWRMQ
jgi:hypothetical protein